MSWFDTLLWPLMWVVAWIMYLFHKGLTFLGLESGSGLTWTLSIIGLVITIRVLLIPLFVRQINAARGMQMLSPELQALQKKYKGKTDPASREAMTRETMDLYKKHGTNPFSSCLPLLAQSPIFFALFRVLSNLGNLADGKFQGGKSSIGPLTQQLAQQANDATIFGAKISDRFLMEGASNQTKIVAVALIILMSLTTFTTQKQLTQKNMPASALQGPMAQQQKMLMYVLPLVFALSGVSFPIGVLIYWSTTNFWSMGQQFYVIRRNPTPGSEADRLLKERRARKAAAKGIVLEDEPSVVDEADKPKGQRQQPVRKDRARTRPPGTAPGDRSAGGAAARDQAGAARPGTGKSPTRAGAGGTTSGTGKPGAGKPSAGRTGTGATPTGAGKSGAGRPSGAGRAATPTESDSGAATTARPASGGERPARGAGASGARPTGGKGRRPADGARTRADGTGAAQKKRGSAAAHNSESQQDEAGLVNPQDET